MITKTIRDGLVPAAFLFVLAAGCGGGGSVAPSPSAPREVPAAGARSAADFERYRASVEASARRDAPAGYQVTVGSTYASKDRKSLYSDANVAFKTVDEIGFQVG